VSEYFADPRSPLEKELIDNPFGSNFGLLGLGDVPIEIVKLDLHELPESYAQVTLDNRSTVPSE
jgi:hypothetical protein